MVRRLAGACAAGLFLLAAPLSHAQTDLEDWKDQFDRFQLWNGCGPMNLAVENLPDDAGEIGLTRDAITAAARSRLRAARLYEDEVTPVLSVSVNVVGRAFGTDIELIKRVTDDNGLRGIAVTWRIRTTGTHGGVAGYILSSIARSVDRFIDEYLRVNADAC